MRKAREGRVCVGAGIPKTGTARVAGRAMVPCIPAQTRPDTGWGTGATRACAFRVAPRRKK